MDPSETLSPGAGAFYGLEDYMAKQAAQKHQTLLDNLAVQKAAHETDNERQDYELRKQEFEERKQEFQDDNRWKVEAAKATAAKADKEAKALDDYINAQPMGSPQRMAAEAKRAGATINPSEFAPKTPAMVPVFGHNAKGQVVDAQGNVVTQVPQGAKIEPIAPVKDTTASDIAREDRESAHLDTIKHDAFQEINSNPIVKSTEDTINSLNKLDLSLRQNSNVGDSTVGEQVLRITAGGPGSGIRMSMPMINQVLKGSRSQWDDVSLALNKWKSSGGVQPDGTINPKVPLTLTDDQRASIYKLARSMRTMANDKHKAIIDARRKVNSAKTSEGAFNAPTDLFDDLAKEPAEEPAEIPAVDKMSPADAIALIRGKK